MAKSTRSKVKRSFRAKKRTEGVYAAVEAARLNRLHQKLKVLTTRDRDGDVEIPEEEVDASNSEGEEQPGWCWFATFGLLDPAEVTAEGLQAIDHLALRSMPAAISGTRLIQDWMRRDAMWDERSRDEEDDGSTLFNHLFAGPSHSEVGCENDD